MRSKLLIVFGVLCLGLSVSAVIAQTPSDNPIVRIVQVHVKPGMTAQYEAARKDLIAELARQKYPYGFTESRDENLVYRRIMTLDNWADLDKRDAELARIRPSIDPSILSRLHEAIDHLTHWIMRTRPELGYAPDNPRLSTEEVGLYHYAYLYLRRGTEDEAGAAIKKFRALVQRHTPRSGYLVAQAVTGPDVPMLIVRFSAKDAADFYTQSQRLQNAAGSEYQTILTELRKTYRRLEQSNNTVVPGLAYQPSDLPTN